MNEKLLSIRIHIYRYIKKHVYRMIFFIVIQQRRILVKLIWILVVFNDLIYNKINILLLILSHKK